MLHFQMRIFLVLRVFFVHIKKCKQSCIFAFFGNYLASLMVDPMQGTIRLRSRAGPAEEHAERIIITRRWHDASAFERLAGRRVSQKHGSKAAGTRTAAAEAAGPAGGRRRGRRIKQKADEHGFSSGCTDVNCGTWIPGISVKTAILGV